MAPQFPLDLLEGFAMDAREHAYRSIDDTILYSYHVAGVVGVMMAIIMGAKDTATLNRACDLGIAFQLTNISRDVIDDAKEGRVYLPADWLEAAGVAPGAIADPANREAVFEVTARLLDTAEAYYASARHGLAALPFRSAWAIAAARRVYRDIGTLVRASGSDPWSRRRDGEPCAQARRGRRRARRRRSGALLRPGRQPARQAGPLDQARTGSLEVNRRKPPRP